MSIARQLAARLRQSVQGCTLHIHGPVQSWAAIEQACAQGQTTYDEVAEHAIESCTRRIDELIKEGTAADDKRVAKELTTRAFVERLLLGCAGPIAKLTPYLSVDVIIRNARNPQEIVYIERKNPPHGWALPGGFVEIGETVEHAAQRECREEIGLELVDLTLLGVYSNPIRDRRGHVVSVVFSALGKGELVAGSDARSVKYGSIDHPPELVFDHADILRDYARTVSLKG